MKKAIDYIYNRNIAFNKKFIFPNVIDKITLREAKRQSAIIDWYFILCLRLLNENIGYTGIINKKYKGKKPLNELEII